MTDAAAATLEVSLDVAEMSAAAIGEGWGDGLPLIAPTADRVAEFIAASGRGGDATLGNFKPLDIPCTVEKVAVNAVMAGAPAAAMPLILAMVEATMAPEFDLAGANATTASVVPAFVVNGEIRHRLGIPFAESALGGVASPAPAIGRAVRLIMRNVAGQQPGKTTESVYGQPGRVAGIVVGEWEERSPWGSLAARRGVNGDAVTAFGVLGTTNVIDTVAKGGREILEVLGKSLAYMGNNNFSHGSTFAEQLIAVNPLWAENVIARDIPTYDDARQVVFEAARMPLDWFPAALRPGIEERGRVDKDGNAYLMESPEEVHIIVCGGVGNLHGAMLPGFSHCEPVTKAVN